MLKVTVVSVLLSTKSSIFTTELLLLALLMSIVIPGTRIKAVEFCVPVIALTINHPPNVIVVNPV